MRYTLPDFEIEIELTCHCCIGSTVFNLFLYVNTHTADHFPNGPIFQQCLVFRNTVCDHKDGCYIFFYFYNTSQPTFKKFLNLVSFSEMFYQIHDCR